MEIPSTVGQIVVLIAVVLPGLVFAGVRSGLRGYGLDDVSAGTRVAQALLAGVLFDLVYVVVFGEWLVRRTVAYETQDPRLLALIVIGLGVAGPAAVAFLVFGRPFRWKWRMIPIPDSPYRSEPSAWDYKLPHSGGQFVRIHFPDGVTVVGGWCGSGSYVSTYPQSRDIYLESQWQLKKDGSFLRKLPQSAGVWVSVPDGSIVEFTGSS